MGLLTDPSAGQGKIIRLLLRYYSKLCVLLYIGGIVYFALLASTPFNLKTYISENALLPGLVMREFTERDEKVANLYHQEYLDMVEMHDDSLPYEWFIDKFKHIGLDSYVHNFSLNYPLGKKQKFTGKNVYAILRAPRAASTEAIILSVPFRPPSSVHLTTAPSIAIMLAFAKYAAKGKYWAKDVIFLVTEHEQLGVQAWLEAYHGVSCGTKDILMSGDLKGRAGAIQAAVNLELHYPVLTTIDVKIEGLNGQLPNLDMYNLAARMTLKDKYQVSFKNEVGAEYSDRFKDWKHGFKTLMKMLATHATGVPDGNHGLYFRFGIQAVTIESFEPTDKILRRAGFKMIGVIIETMFRSLNNLLERLHQSFFFYLLAGPQRFISIGLYIPAICVLAATLFIKSYAKWCQLHETDKEDSESEEGSGDAPRDTLSEKQLAKRKLQMDSISMEEWKRRFEDECAREYPDDDRHLSFGHICLVMVLSHIFGFGLKDLPRYLSNVGADYGYATDVSVYYGLALISALALFVPLLFKKPCYRSMELLNVMLLLELGTALICVSMYNISLGMFLAAVYVPAALLINPSSCGLCNKLQKVFWLLTHPFLLVTVAVLVYTFVTFPGEPLDLTFYRGIDAARKAFVFAVVDSMIYGNWLFNVITTVFYSNWLCFWYVTFSPSPPKTVSSQKLKKE